MCEYEGNFTLKIHGCHLETESGRFKKRPPPALVNGHWKCPWRRWVLCALAPDSNHGSTLGELENSSHLATGYPLPSSQGFHEL